HLRERDEPRGVDDGHVAHRLARLADRHALQRGRPALVDVLVEEALAGVSFGRAQERERPLRDVRKHPLGDLLVVAREVELRQPDLGPEDAIGMRQPDARHRGLRVPAWRRRDGTLAYDLGRALVLAQPLERRMTELAVTGPFGERDLADQLGTDEV